VIAAAAPVEVADATLVGEVEVFLAAESPLPAFSSLDHKFAYLVDYQRRLHAAGLAVPGWAPEHGGRGLGVRAGAVVASALGARGAPELINYTGTDVVGPALLSYVDEARLTRLLPPIASADDIWCQLFSEPDSGSDLASLRTRAERCDDGWRVNGQKVWSTWAPYSDLGLLLARTGQPDSRHRGLSAFVIPMRSPGITIRPLRTMTGSAEFAEVFFEDLVVPADAVVGEVDDGWGVATAMLNAERGIYAVRRASVIAATLGQLLRQARSVSFDAAARRAIVAAVVDQRLLEWRIDRLVDQIVAGEPIGPESAVTKVLMTAAEQTVLAAVAAALGPNAGAWRDHSTAARVEDYLYSRSASIHGGTAQIQRNLIGERLLGLPR
jgi:alkylation response protein AidB-like acyl-CoA dehydrogenase